MKKFISMTAVALCTLAAQALANVEGFWTTIDDETGEAKSVVQVYKYKGKVYGRVVELLKNKGATAKIPGNPSTLGLDIIWGLTQDDDEYNGGKVLDPEKGSVYRCSMWRDGDELKMRGKLGIFFRTQTWKKNTTFKPASSAAPVPKIPKVD
ncbi:MAG: DUF2147 domain-containing protein [Akkermansia sp.]|nr:DUF2147 domain-containing protein [Akkermansia sp.]